MERGEVLERYCGWQNEVTLLKQTLKDGPCFHAAGALQLNAWKSSKVSKIHYQEIWLINKMFLDLRLIFTFSCYHVCIAHQRHEQNITHTTFQQLTPYSLYEIHGFEILSSEKHFCRWEISEILFGAEV